jgi:hypothetical protein
MPLGLLLGVFGVGWKMLGDGIGVVEEDAATAVTLLQAFAHWFLAQAQDGNLTYSTFVRSNRVLS